MISDKQVTSKQKYKNLKRKLKLLLYEQECFLDELRKSERKMIKVQRDKNFLLDRLMQYERVEDSSVDSDSTVSSCESESDIPSASNSRTASAKPERGSPGASSGFVGAHFPFGQPPSMDLSPTSMMSSSMPASMFAGLHPQGSFAANASMNGPGGMGGQRLVSGSPAAPRGRGRPRAGGQGGITRGGGGGRGTRGRGGGAGPPGMVVGPVGTGGPSSSTGPQGTPSRGGSANGNYATNQSSQLGTSSLGSPTAVSGGVLTGGDLTSSFSLFSPENSASSSGFMGSQPQSQSQQQRYTPQPQSVNQPQSGSLTPTGQQQQTIMQYSQGGPQSGQQPGLMGPPQSQQFIQQQMLPADILLEGVMTHEDVERCLESTGGPDRFLYERIPGDLPADIFSENSEDDVGGIGNSVSSEA